MIKKTLLKIVEARYSISSWLWAGVSTASGVIMASIIKEGTDPALEAFLDALPVIEPMLWATMIAIFSIITMLGMLVDSDIVVGTGSFICFILWVFGIIAFTLVGNATTVILLVAPFLIFFAWLFIGSMVRDSNRI